MLKPLMKKAEIELLRECLCFVKSGYFEFGLGGSTVLASNLLHEIDENIRIFGIDDLREWITQVQDNLVFDNVSLGFVEIGETKLFGYPKDRKAKLPIWKNYSKSITLVNHPIDLVLVDGRFRAACFLCALSHCKEGTRILMHDYYRASYHAVETVSKPVRVVKDLALFEVLPLSNSLKMEIERLYDTFWYDCR